MKKIQQNKQKMRVFALFLMWFAAKKRQKCLNAWVFLMREEKEGKTISSISRDGHKRASASKIAHLVKRGVYERNIMERINPSRPRGEAALVQPEKEQNPLSKQTKPNTGWPTDKSLLRQCISQSFAFIWTKPLSCRYPTEPRSNAARLI